MDPAGFVRCIRKYVKLLFSLYAVLTGSAHPRLLALFLSSSYVHSYIYMEENCLSDNPKRKRMWIINCIALALRKTNENTPCVPYHITHQSTIEIFMTGFHSNKEYLGYWIHHQNPKTPYWNVWVRRSKSVFMKIPLTERIWFTTWAK